MINVHMLSDKEISEKISGKLKELRLKQNISRKDMSDLSGVSISTLARMEEGEIKTFESFLRILRTLGKIDVLMPLLQEEISPAEYFKQVHSLKTKTRRRASKSRQIAKKEDTEW